MISNRNFREGSTGEVVIRDVSAEAVEQFLLFLHSGEVTSKSVSTVVEVAELARKYEVPELFRYCTEDLAWQPVLGMGSQPLEWLRCADHFQLTELRREALDQVLLAPDNALNNMPPEIIRRLGPRLLDEILGSELLCMDDRELCGLLHVLAAGVEHHKPPPKEGLRLDEVLWKYINGLRHAGEPSARHTCDALNDLYQQWQRSSERGPFLGYWVNVIPGQTDIFGADDLSNVASNNCALHIKANSWITWMLPHAPLYLLGISFERGVPESTHFQVSTSEDGTAWHLALDSRTGRAFPPGGGFKCRHYPNLIRWIKLHVLEGSFENDFRLNGIFSAGSLLPWRELSPRPGAV
mmetsp:Transcript_6591/g.11932  ORF Transcript_6591/g.11932 Transcript_6591/m.11932 type:complete len:352 (+) Transcript_6591:1-1056(+)